jgi:DNA repair ATPase RecN
MARKSFEPVPYNYADLGYSGNQKKEKVVSEKLNTLQAKLAELYNKLNEVVEVINKMDGQEIPYDESRYDTANERYAQLCQEIQKAEDLYQRYDQSIDKLIDSEFEQVDTLMRLPDNSTKH